MSDGDGRLSPDRYLGRLGIDPATVAGDLATLERLQRAHVTRVPFETLSITGDPFDGGDGERIVLSVPALYGKVVERRRGGFCFELNGLFGWLLDELGFDVTRVAGRMAHALDTPANHHPLLVTLDREYLVDVGMGAPVLRWPVALGSTAGPDAAGVAWRVRPSDRPDADHVLQQRPDEEWVDRYVFDTTPRSLSYFEATCDYLQSAPESGFTGAPTVLRATADGVVTLTPETFSRSDPDGTAERAVDEAEYRRLLEREFGIEPVT